MTQTTMREEKLADHVNRGREHIAKLAEADGEILFARQVRAGSWDHRNDVAWAIAKAKEAARGP